VFCQAISEWQNGQAGSVTYETRDLFGAIEDIADVLPIDQIFTGIYRQTWEVDECIGTAKVAGGEREHRQMRDTVSV
jgi:hypothetical protein